MSQNVSSRCWAVGAVALWTCLGCVNVSVSRVGERFPSKPGNCDLDYQYGDTSKMMALIQAGFVQVGAITVVKGGDSFDDEMKARIGPKACELGGELVLMGASSPGSFDTNYSYASLMVFRMKEIPAQESPGTTRL